MGIHFVSMISCRRLLLELSLGVANCKLWMFPVTWLRFSLTTAFCCSATRLLLPELAIHAPSYLHILEVNYW
jgi:hypothetical protein